jgi:hypothetical protein
VGVNPKWSSGARWLEENSSSEAGGWLLNDEVVERLEENETVEDSFLGASLGKGDSEGKGGSCGKGDSLENDGAADESVTEGREAGKLNF